MILYTTALLSLLAYSSEGASLTHTSVNGSVASSLYRLANACEDKFLVDQIKSKINECNVVVPPYTETAVQCLLFYEMSIQLCAAVSSAKLAFKEDYSTLINQPLDVRDLCKVAKSWEITNLPDYPLFMSTAGKVFQNDNLCAKLCGVPEVISSESNYFCKYFNWGSSLLNSILQSRNMSSAVQVTGPISVNAATAPEPSKPVAQILSQPRTEKTQMTTNHTEHTTNIKVENPPARSEISDIEVKEKEIRTKPVIQISHVLPHQQGLLENNNLTVSQPSAVPEAQSVDGGENMDKPILADLHPALPAETNIPKEKPKAQNEPAAVGAGFVKQPNVDQIRIPVPDELGDQDYQDQDLEGGKEGLADMQGGDDGDDPILMEQENKPVHEQPNAPNRIQTPSSYATDREMNNYPYSDGDDHFFPFFLTSIILVALLYVLYHNKSKVSKVVLGLIVEGRQNGRRRNSRGHSYRRLDTLEQAMSAPTAAAPTKIIY